VNSTKPFPLKDLQRLDEVTVWNKESSKAD
jgi:hypothetical protein